MQAASALIDSPVRINEPGSRSAPLAGGKILDRRNTAVTGVWDNPKMALILSGNQYGTAESRLMRGYRGSTRHEIRDEAMARALDAAWGFTTTDVAGYEPSRDTKTVFARTFATALWRASAGLA